MQDLVQTVKFSVILPKHRANYEGITQTLVITGTSAVMCCLIHDHCYTQHFT